VYLSAYQEKNIGAVLTVARGGRLSHSVDHVKHYLYIPAEDHEAYDIAQFFTNAFEFIEKARRETNVLIHCMAGISRSATITAAYLIMKFGYDMNTVLNLLQRKRKQVIEGLCRFYQTLVS
jgi:protein-tyrosine phosphatase